MMPSRSNSLRTDYLRTDYSIKSLASVHACVAGGAVDELADDVEMTDMAGGLLDHVAEDVADRCRLVVGLTLFDGVQWEVGDRLVGARALGVVLVQELGERDVVDEHLGVGVSAFGPRSLAGVRGPVQAELEPRVLDPAQMRHQPRRRHQRRGGHDLAVGIFVAESFALHPDEGTLQIKPSDQLAALVSGQRRTLYFGHSKLL